MALKAHMEHTRVLVALTLAAFSVWHPNCDFSEGVSNRARHTAVHVVYVQLPFLLKQSSISYAPLLV
eukprot:3589347-Amphidinium_carterae.1